MSVKEACLINKEATNELEIIHTALKVYAAVTLKTPLSPRELTVLTQYILKGYSKKTKKTIEIDLNIDERNLNTLNHSLQKKNFLLPHPTNQRNKVLNPDLINIKSTLCNEQNQMKCIIVKFN